MPAVWLHRRCLFPIFWSDNFAQGPERVSREILASNDLSIGDLAILLATTAPASAQPLQLPGVTMASYAD
jgi:hypothetical protein